MFALPKNKQSNQSIQITVLCVLDYKYLFIHFLIIYFSYVWPSNLSPARTKAKIKITGVHELRDSTEGNVLTLHVAN